MAHPVVMTPRMEVALERLRPIALGFEGAEERISHGSPTFFTGPGRKGRIFVSLHDEREHFEGRLCIWAPSEQGVREALIEADPARYLVPPYVGHRGWVGLRLDIEPVDWDEVAGLVEDGHSLVS